VAGLLAARVLSDHFQEVLIVEREGLATSAEPRKNVPQGRHVHVLLQSGIQVIERLFPGLLVSMLSSDLLVRSDVSRDFRWRHFGVWKARFHSGIDIVFMYRPSFEWNLAAQVSGINNVKVLIGSEATGLCLDANDSRTTGITLRRYRTSGEEAIETDLVVDAAGRGSQTPKWLRSMGFDGPPESRVEVNIGYASRIYARPAGMVDSSPLFVLPQPPDTRGGAIFPIEGSRWMVTLTGWTEDYPPADDKEYLEFAATLDVPDIHDALRKAVALTEISVHKFPASVWRRYDKMEALPESLIVLGDAMCSFNPVYAQGMSVSALEAVALDRCLTDQSSARSSFSLSRTFHRAAARIISNPWRVTAGEDLRYPATRGERPLSSGFLRWYAGLVHKATSTDERVARQFYNVLSLIDPPESLFSPGVAIRTAAYSSFR